MAHIYEVVLDTETTGLCLRGDDRIVEVGCVKLVDRVANGEVYHAYINPKHEVAPQALAIHGLSNEFLQDKPEFHEIAEELLAFIDGANLVIHNAGFDLGFLNKELSLLELPLISPDNVIDSLALAQRKYPGKPNSLSALCHRYKIDTSHRVLHGALLDAELLAEVYLHLLGGSQGKLSFSDTVPTHQITEGTGQEKTSNRERYSSRFKTGAISEEELREHRKFVATLGPKAVWLRYNERRVPTT